MQYHDLAFHQKYFLLICVEAYNKYKVPDVLNLHRRQSVTLLKNCPSAIWSRAQRFPCVQICVMYFFKRIFASTVCVLPVRNVRYLLPNKRFLFFIRWNSQRDPSTIDRFYTYMICLLQSLLHRYHSIYDITKPKTGPKNTRYQHRMVYFFYLILYNDTYYVLGTLL